MKFYLLPTWVKQTEESYQLQPFKDLKGDILKDNKGEPIQKKGKVFTKYKVLRWLFFKLWEKKV